MWSEPASAAAISSESQTLLIGGSESHDQTNKENSYIVLLIAIAAMLLIAFLPPETEEMSRAAWKYLGCFAFMLVTMIGQAFPDWACVLASMGLIVAMGAGSVTDVTSSFAGSTLWLIIGVFIMSIGINNSGIMKRIALWVLIKFPGTYIAQVAAMLLAGLITTPMIPSAFAKTSIMAPFTAQVSEALELKPNTNPALGLWYANFLCTYSLGNAFLSGSAFVALMIGYIGSTFTWGEWLSTTWVWYIINIVLIFVFCAFICKPKSKGEEGNVEFLKEQYKALGPVSRKEKQASVIIVCALILWITQKIHGIDAGMVALIADVAFVACGLITAPEANAKGQWTLICFIGGVLSIAGMMNSNGVGNWIAGILGPIAAPFMSNPYIFVLFLIISTYLLRYIIVSQTCCLTIYVGLFAPLCAAAGINNFVVVFVVYMSSMLWNSAYMNPSVAGFVRMAGEKYVPYSLAAKGSYFWMVQNLAAMMLSVPVWMHLGFFG